ncbi:hypothetical protein CR513_25412, partial [Mucuna pruriens]
MLLFNSRLNLIAVELKDKNTNNTFQVNEHHLKEFHEMPISTMGEVESISLEYSSNSNSSNSISSSGNSSLVTNTSNSVEYSSTNNFAKPKPMENNDQTLKELATPNVYPQLEPAQSYKLKSGLIHLLPKFHSLVGEDPHKHLKEFHVVCSKMTPHGIPEDYIKMKSFPFSLDGVAKD